LVAALVPFIIIYIPYKIVVELIIFLEKNNYFLFLFTEIYFLPFFIKKGYQYLLLAQIIQYLLFFHLLGQRSLLADIAWFRLERSKNWIRPKEPVDCGFRRLAEKISKTDVLFGPKAGAIAREKRKRPSSRRF
jgi:hypothetical protein